MDDSMWNSEIDAVLREWLKRARESQHSHHEAGKFCRRMNYCLSIPVIVITTAVGTKAFTALESDLGENSKLWLGILSMLAAILTILQMHLNLAERGERHKSLGARYGNIRRMLEGILVLPYSQRDAPTRTLAEMRERLDTIGAEGPVVSRWIFEASNARLSKRDQARARLDSAT